MQGMGVRVAGYGGGEENDAPELIPQSPLLLESVDEQGTGHDQVALV